MRPIKRGESPIEGEFQDYKDAKPELISRLGSYCSYCERRVVTNLAVEHIQPKDGDNGHPELIGCWENFLLACVNCNSTKSAKRVELDQYLLPDRDNTFHAYTYSEDGTISVDPGLQSTQSNCALKTLQLVGLDKSIQSTLDSHGNQIAIDRVSQRMEAWATAEVAYESVCSQPDDERLLLIAEKLAASTGFFSVWMTVFHDLPNVKIRLVRAFNGTKESGCFDMNTGEPISPAPNPDNLESGGKV